MSVTKLTAELARLEKSYTKASKVRRPSIQSKIDAVKAELAKTEVKRPVGRPRTKPAEHYTLVAALRQPTRGRPSRESVLTQLATLGVTVDPKGKTSRELEVLLRDTKVAKGLRKA